ncbi:MAG TPA: DUF2142 domain-containing protein [Acidimicrobiales bacterium]|nr:DUF2142 domain-containing protein [Acidimicrobiales bacterium]
MLLATRVAATGTSSAQSRASRPALFRVFLPAWALVFVLAALWALASPLGSSPDAPSQIARAASVVRGQWVGPSAPGPGSNVTTLVRVPRTYALEAADSRCFMFLEAVSAECATPQPVSGKLVTVQSHVGRYPPLYYAMVGWPSLLTYGAIGTYLMEMVSALICALFIALALTIATVYGRSRLLMLAVGVAATPMTLYLAGTVNPSGLELACALSMWCSLAVWVRWYLHAPPAPVVAVAAVSTCALVWTRPTAFAWPVLAAVVFAPIVWRERHRGERQYPSRKLVQRSTVAVALALLGSLAWTLLARATAVLPNFSPLPKGSSWGHIFFYVATDIPWLAVQAVGNFGHLDTPVPRPVLAVWAVVAAALVAGALRRGTARSKVSLGLLLVFSYAFPFASLVVAAPSFGFIGQGRYFLPLWGAIPVVAACWLPEQKKARVAGAMGWLGGTALMLAQVASFYWGLRRYVTGVPGAWSLSGPRGKVWAPPLGAWWLIALFALGCAALLVLAVRWSAGTSAEGHGALGPHRPAHLLGSTGR